MSENNLPKCMKCIEGQLVPLSDTADRELPCIQGLGCINPVCGFNIKIRNGDIYLNEPITPGGMNTSRTR